MDEPVLVIGLRFQFTRSRRRPLTRIRGRAQRFGEKQDGGLAHLHQVPADRVQFRDVVDSCHCAQLSLQLA